MTPVNRRRYSAEFKAQAIGLVEMGKPVSEVAQDLEISEGVLYAWVRKGSPARHSGAQGRAPEASGPQRTSAVACAAKSPISNLRTTF
jgi:transposase-like protein